MALAELLEALRRDAAASRAAVLDAADRRVERIHLEGEAALTRRRADVLAHVRAEEEKVARRTVAHAEAEAERSVLTARERLLERVRAHVEAYVSKACDDPRYIATLPEEIRRALSRLPVGPVVVRTQPALAHAIEDALRVIGGPERGRVTVQTVDGMAVGFTATAAGGVVEVDATLERRLSQVWPRLAVGVLAEVAP